MRRISPLHPPQRLPERPDGRPSGDHAVDLAKFFMAILVVALHVPPFHFVSPALDHALTYGLTRIAVPYCFVATAYYLFRKMVAGTIDRAVLGRYVRRIARVYLLWSLIYLPLIAVQIVQDPAGIGHGLWSALHHAIVIHTYPHLWFLYALLLAVPLLAFLLARGLRLCTVFWCAVASYAIAVMGSSEPALYHAYAPQHVQDIFAALRQIFLSCGNPLTVAPVFLLIGASLAWHPPQIGTRRLVVLLAAAAVLFAAEAAWAIPRGLPDAELGYYASLVPLLYLLFELTRRIRLPESGIYLHLRRLSMFLYCIHPWWIWILAGSGILPGVTLARYETPAAFAAVIALSITSGILVMRLSARPRFRFLKALF